MQCLSLSLSHFRTAKSFLLHHPTVKFEHKRLGWEMSQACLLFSSLLYSKCSRGTQVYFSSAWRTEFVICFISNIVHKKVWDCSRVLSGNKVSLSYIRMASQMPPWSCSRIVAQFGSGVRQIEEVALVTLPVGWKSITLPARRGGRQRVTSVCQELVLTKHLSIQDNQTKSTHRYKSVKNVELKGYS